MKPARRPALRLALNLDCAGVAPVIKFDSTAACLRALLTCPRDTRSSPTLILPASIPHDFPYNPRVIA